MRRRQQRRTTVVAVVLAVVLLAAACSSSSGSTSSPNTTQRVVPPPTPGGTLVVETSSEVDGFNPLTSQWSGPGFQIARAVLDPLAVMDAQGHWQPYLAKAFDHNDDFTEWTIRLRPNVSFHNGEVLDADALIVYLQAALASPLASNAFPEKPTLAKVDDLSVRLTFTRPWSELPAVLADQPGYVIAPEQVRSGDSTHPIGTGPFVYQDWVPDRYFKAVRNDHYWQQGLPYLDSIEFRPAADPTTRFNALTSGDAQVAEAGSTTQAKLDELAGQGQHVIDDVDNTGTILMIFNLDRPVVSDHRVREAIVRAIDPEAFRNAVYDDSYPIVTEPYPSDSRWYSDNGYPTYDPERARALVDEYEADNGPIKITVSTNGVGEQTRPLEYLAEALAQVGIDVTIDGLETVAFVSKFVAGDYDAVFVQGFFGTADPDGISTFLSSANAAPDNPIKLNFARYRSDVVDQALAAQRATDDDAARAAEWAKVWKAFAQDLPYAFLLQTRMAFVTAPDVFGIEGFTAPDGAALPAINRWTPFYTGAYVASS